MRQPPSGALNVPFQTSGNRKAVEFARLFRMKPVQEVPLAQPDKAVAEVLRAITIGLLGRRYRLDIKVYAQELKPEPAAVIPIKPVAATGT